MLAMSTTVVDCPSMTVVGAFVVGGLLARSTAVVVNDIVDRHVDAKVRARGLL